MAHPQMIRQTTALKYYLEEYGKMRSMILLQQDIDPNHQPLDLFEYAKYALHNGSLEEKRELINALGENLYIHDRFVSSSPVKSQLRMINDVYGTIGP